MSFIPAKNIPAPPEETFHADDLYDRYFYHPDFIEGILEAFDHFAPAGPNLTFIELFSGSGYIGKQALDRLSPFAQAHLYEYSDLLIEKGRRQFNDARMHFFRQDLAQPIAPAAPSKAFMYIGAQSHQYLTTSEGLRTLGENCGKLCTPGSKLMIYMAGLDEWLHDIHLANTGNRHEETLGDSHGGLSFHYEAKWADPLTAIMEYRLAIHSADLETRSNFTMRYWSAAEIIDHFPGFQFKAHSLEDYRELDATHPQELTGLFYLVGTRK